MVLKIYTIFKINLKYIMGNINYTNFPLVTIKENIFQL